MNHNKKYYILCIIIFCLPLSTISAQPELNGALGVPFGAAMQTAKKIMLKKPGVRLVNKSMMKLFDIGSAPIFCFTGVTMGGYVIDTCYLVGSLKWKFNPVSKLDDILLSFKDGSDGTYYAILQILREKYGNPDRSTDVKSEGISTFWNFPVEGTEKTNYIWLTHYAPDNMLRLEYSGFGTNGREKDRRFKQQRR